LIQEGLGNPSAALVELGNALEIGEKYGYVRLFDHSPQLDRLLDQAAVRKIHSQYARQLLSSFNRIPSDEKTGGIALPRQKGSGILVDPLSEREVEVLKLLADGLTPANVAKRLVVSPNTLKAHTQNIYSKLDVHSRIEAITKARELELI
jgi:LuxR family maltose regulon positive regulatory protein